MSKVINLEAKSITSEDAEFGSINAKRYNNLPIANKFTPGVVKIDNDTIKIDEDGVIYAQLKFEDEGMNEHIGNLEIHISEEDRNNLIILDSHLNNANIHLTKTDRANFVLTTEHLDKPHLTEEEIEAANNHIKAYDLHFDNKTQKDEFLLAMMASVKVKQASPNKILLTDASKNVILSEIDSTVLENLVGLTDPITDILLRYALKDHDHNGYLSRTELENHTGDGFVHFVENEKEELNAEIANLQGGINGINEGNMLTIARLDRANKINSQKKLKFRYIRDALRNTIYGEGKDLKWSNCAIYKDGVNIATSLPIANISVSEGMSMPDESKTKYIDGTVDVVAHTHHCTCDNIHSITIDLGSVLTGISHIEMVHCIGDTFEHILEVSEDGDEWYPLYDTSILPLYEDDSYGKTHITNFEAYMSLFTRK